MHESRLLNKHFTYLKSCVCFSGQCTSYTCLCVLFLVRSVKEFSESTNTELSQHCGVLPHVYLWTNRLSRCANSRADVKLPEGTSWIQLSGMSSGALFHFVGFLRILPEICEKQMWMFDILNILTPSALRLQTVHATYQHNGFSEKPNKKTIIVAEAWSDNEITWSVFASASLPSRGRYTSWDRSQGLKFSL